MANVTLEIGPPWKMELLRDVLAEHGVSSFVAGANMKTIDPFVTGAMSFDARLEVAEEAVPDARAALAEARTEGEALRSASGEPDEGEEPGDAALEELAELGRRIRWASVLFWMHPFVFAYGKTYLAWLSRVRSRPAGHALTLFALTGVAVIWGVAICTVVVVLFRAAAEI